MKTQNTLYIAEPIFSENLQKFDPTSSFPPIKKIGITTDHPERREKELLGTLSPIKISIIKAWTNIDARAIESMLHNILDNLRLDGEYFWDGNETLVESVSDFISKYHPETEEIIIDNDSDVKAASNAANKKYSQRIYSEAIPELEEMKIKYSVTKNEKGVRFTIDDYKFHLGAKTNGRYTLTIWSKSKTTDEALNDFQKAIELSAQGSEESDRVARIPMSPLEDVMLSIKKYKNRNA